jgi:hypothetical protein
MTEEVPLGRSRYHQRPNAPLDGAASVSIGHGPGGLLRYVFQSRGIARLEFVAQRSALAKPDCRIEGGCWLACGRHNIDYRVGKSGGSQVAANLVFVVVAARGAFGGFLGCPSNLSVLPSWTLEKLLVPS